MSAPELIDALVELAAKANTAERRWIAGLSERLAIGPAFTSRELTLMQSRVNEFRDR